MSTATRVGRGVQRDTYFRAPQSYCDPLEAYATRNDIPTRTPLSRGEFWISFFYTNSLRWITDFWSFDNDK